MSARNGRVIGWVLAAVLLGMSSASSAASWIGGAKMTGVCPGLGSDSAYEEFTLQMEPGSGIGTLTMVGLGGAPVNVVTDWIADGKWSYFSASIGDPAGGVVALTGWIRGSKLRGWIVMHDYQAGCVLLGKIRGYAS